MLMAVVFKKDTRSGLPIVKMLQAIDIAYSQAGVTPVVTSMNDGTHMVNSLHYADRAIDVRTWNVPGQPNPCTGDPCAAVVTIMQHLRQMLGSSYQVIWESDIPGKRTQHLHIEYQPK